MHMENTMPRRKAAAGGKGDKSSSSMGFLLDFMKSHPKAVYGDAHQAALRAGHKIFPIMWGRAQVMLGRVKAKARGTAKAARVAAAPSHDPSTWRSAARCAPGGDATEHTLREESHCSPACASVC